MSDGERVEPPWVHLSAFETFGDRFGELRKDRPSHPLGMAPVSFCDLEGLPLGESAEPTAVHWKLLDWLRTHQTGVAGAVREAVYDRYTGESFSYSDWSRERFGKYEPNSVLEPPAPRVIHGTELDPLMRLAAVWVFHDNQVPAEDAIDLFIENTWDTEHGAWQYRLDELTDDGAFQLAEES